MLILGIENGCTCISRGQKSTCKNLRSSQDEEPNIDGLNSDGLFQFQMNCALRSCDAHSVLRQPNDVVLADDVGAAKRQPSLGHLSTLHQSRACQFASTGILVMDTLSCTCRIRVLSQIKDGILIVAVMLVNSVLPSDNSSSSAHLVCIWSISCSTIEEQKGKAISVRCLDCFPVAHGSSR